MLSNEDFVTLVREHQSALRGFIRSLGIDPMWVDDVAQEALVIAYERRTHYDAGMPFRNWVWGIARNCVLNDRRKSARRNRILNENITDILLSTASNEPELAELNDVERDRLSALRTCLSSMPEKSRELVLHRYEKNLRAADLAEHFNMNSAAVRKSLERIRLSIRKCMETRLEENKVLTSSCRPA